MATYGDSVDNTRTHTETNRRGWNELAPHRRPRPAEFWQRGGSTLDAVEIEALPDVRGARMLHLACANGDDSLSWAARGACVTGVDISDVAVAMAKASARAARLGAHFLAADVYALPADLGDFDVVYASWGVVCWLPDVAQWARIVTGLLRPGGTFLLCEHHPVWEVLAPRGSCAEVTADYFGREVPTHLAAGKQAVDQSKRPTGSSVDTALTTFTWPVGDVVTSLLQAGLRLDALTEHALPRLYAGLDRGAGWLPATYVIRATKP